MVTQRAAGLRAASLPLVVLLDDDIVLEPNAVEILLEPLQRGRAICAVPFWPESWPRPGLRRWLNAFWGIAVPRRQGGIDYTPGGGYYYPLTEPPSEGWGTRGGAGAVIAVSGAFVIASGDLGDLEFQKASVYALRDDGALIYSWHRAGGQCLMVPGVRFRHLEGTTCLSPQRAYFDYLAQIHNQILFWKKYIHPAWRQRVFGSLRARSSLAWYLIGIVFFAVISAIRGRTLQPIRGILAGFFAARKLLRYHCRAGGGVAF
jgi:GT2 family glycosyltransferase